LGHLEGKVSCVTGGASGIGKAIVELFCNEGAKIILADIQDDLGNEIADNLGDNVYFKHTNVSKESDIIELVNSTINKYGKLDIMINNAGFGGVSGPIDKITEEGFDLTVGILLKGVFMGVKHAVKVMKENKTGSIINMSSVAGLRTGFGSHIYSLCKAAVIQLTKTVAQEIGEWGIRINCICPGGIPTGIFTSGLPIEYERRQQITSFLEQRFSDLQPIRRSGTTFDIAKAALWLASEDSGFVTGHSLVVDGGLTTKTLGLLGEEGAISQLYKAVLGTDDEDEIQDLLLEEMMKKFIGS